MKMGALAWIGGILLALWLVAFLVFKVVSGLVHLILIVAVVFLIWSLVKRGARRLRP
ncbi:MAG: hypothetical protein H0V09_00220 [Gemmatimonadetes bacterium]|nr:hypothetical protein [Gemmatimonadota bacterium]